VRRGEVSNKQSSVCVFVESKGSVVDGEEVNPNIMPPGCTYVGVLPSTLTLHDAYSPVTRLLTSSES